MITEYSAWKARRFDLSPDTHRTSSATHQRGAVTGTALPARNPPRVCYAFYSPDQRRDADAQGILASGKLQPIPSARPHEQWAYCISVSDSSIRYWLTTHPSGSATCTCPDWLYRGGACKHMRAFRVLIESWMAQGHLLPGSFYFPTSAPEAEIVEARNRAWYGKWFERSVTSPAQSTTVNSHDLPSQPVKSIALQASMSISRPSAVESRDSALYTGKEPTEMTLPEHLQSARLVLLYVDEAPQLLPPAHPLLGNLLEAEVNRASDVMELTGDSAVVEIDETVTESLRGDEKAEVRFSNWMLCRFRSS